MLKIYTVIQTDPGTMPQSFNFRNEHKAVNHFKRIVKEQIADLKYEGIKHPRSVVRKMIKKAAKDTYYEDNSGYGVFLNTQMI